MADVLVWASDKFGNHPGTALEWKTAKLAAISIDSSLTTKEKAMYSASVNVAYNSRMTVGDLIEPRETSGFANSPPSGPGAGWNTSKFAVVRIADKTKEDMQPYVNASVEETDTLEGKTGTKKVYLSRYFFDFAITAGSVYTFDTLEEANMKDKLNLAGGAIK